MSVISPSGDKTTYTYDGLGNVTQKENGRRKDTFYYTFDGQVGGQSEYINGTLTETAVYNYDDLERLASKVIGEDTTSYTYNTLGSVMSVTSPAGLVTSYTRDDAERVTEVGFDNKEILYQYYADGMVKKITYPNGMTTEYTYDNANRVTNIKTKKGSTVLRNYSYTYDGNGNVLSVSGSENVTYTYDALNRLTGSTKNGVTTTYTYDNRNNIVSETDGTNTKTYEYGGDNRLHKVTENGIETVYEYDLNGNLIKRGEDEFVYDESNRLVYSKVNGTETTYEIGIEGLRTSKTTDGVTTTYNLNESGYVLCENDEDIIYGHTALAKEINGKYYYYIYNAHGDVTALADENGTVVNTYEYDAWGKLTAETEAVECNIGYAGEYYDEETGLIYLRNRYYDPSARRFTTEDPARDDLNWYCYCGNNPVNYVDPSGNYARKKAVEYAEKWYNGRNDKYYSYSTDCANFVSQCIYAGGIEMNDSWHSYRTGEKAYWGFNPVNWFKESKRYNWNISESWRLAKKQYEYFSDPNNGYIEGEVVVIGWETGVKIAASSLNIQPGDLMYFAGENGDNVHHAVIVTKVDYDEIYYAGHTTNAMDKPLSKNLEGEVVLVIRIKNDA